VAFNEDPAVALIRNLVVLAAMASALLCPWRRMLSPFHRLARRAHHVVVTSLGVFRKEPPPDPFEALHVQMRLHAVVMEIGELHIDETVYARAARLEARVLAYDALLRNACQLAGVDDLDEATGRDGRMQRELQLAERGWSW
jgi:hypothetical protein